MGGLPAKDVVSQLGSLHGSPLALSLPIPPLHILLLPQIKVLAHEAPRTLGRGRGGPEQDGYSTGEGGGRPAEGAGHFIGGVGGGASTLAQPPL